MFFQCSVFFIPDELAAMHSGRTASMGNLNWLLINYNKNEIIKH